MGNRSRTGKDDTTGRTTAGPTTAPRARRTALRALLAVLTCAVLAACSSSGSTPAAGQGTASATGGASAASTPAGTTIGRSSTSPGAIAVGKPSVQLTGLPIGGGFNGEPGHYCATVGYVGPPLPAKAKIVVTGVRFSSADPAVTAGGPGCDQPAACQSAETAFTSDDVDAGGASCQVPLQVAPGAAPGAAATITLDGLLVCGSGTQAECDALGAKIAAVKVDARVAYHQAVVGETPSDGPSGTPN